MRVLIALFGLIALCSAQTAGEAETGGDVKDLVPRKKVVSAEYAKNTHNWSPAKELEKKREQARQIKEAESKVKTESNTLAQRQKAARLQMEILQKNQAILDKRIRQKKAEEDQDKANMEMLLSANQAEANNEVQKAKDAAKKQEAAVQAKEAAAAQAVLAQAQKDKNKEQVEKEKEVIAINKEKKAVAEKKEAVKKADNAEKQVQQAQAKAMKKAETEKKEEEAVMKTQLKNQKQAAEKRAADEALTLKQTIDGLKTQLANIQNQLKVNQEQSATDMKNKGSEFQNRVNRVKASAKVQIEKSERDVTLAKDQCVKDKKAAADSCSLNIKKVNDDLSKAHDEHQRSVDANSKAIEKLEGECGDRMRKFGLTCKLDCDSNAKKVAADNTARAQIADKSCKDRIATLNKQIKAFRLGEEKRAKLSNGRIQDKINENNKLRDILSKKDAAIRDLKDRMAAIPQAVAANTGADENNEETFVASSIGESTGLVYSLVALNVLLTVFCAKLYLDSKRNDNTYQATLLEEEF